MTAKERAWDKVYKALSWLPHYASKDEIIAAYKHLAIKQQIEIEKLKKKLEGR